MTTQRQHTKRLATAFRRLDRARKRYEEAQREVDAAFGPWAAGRRTNRDRAREQLVSTGHLEQRRIGR